MPGQTQLALSSPYLYCDHTVTILQEAQLLLGWPTHGAKSIYLEVKAIELN